MHILPEPVKHPRLSNFSSKPKLLRSYFCHSDSASADKKEIFRNSSWNFAGKNSTSVFEALTHPCCLVVRFCTIYFFAWLTVSKNKRGALWILKFDHYKPIWRIITFWREAVTWWLAGTAQSSAGGGPWDEQHLLGWAAQSSWVSTLLNSNSAAAFITNSQDHCFSQSTEMSWDVKCNSAIRGKLWLLFYTSEWTQIIICSWSVRKSWI